VKARVLESYRDEAENGSGFFQGGGPQSALRAYQAYHPDAAIYTVTYRGRTVWMTSKQQAIWHEVQKYWRRGQRDTLARIAVVVGCSKATVSRFLRRLDLWRFIDLATIRGRNGGTYIFTRDQQEPPERWTMSKRARLRAMLAERVKRNQMRELQPLLDTIRLRFKPRPVKVGSTGATFTATTGRQQTLSGEEM
jgi:hypothetical protein